jgi:hypothetical protein
MAILNNIEIRQTFNYLSTLDNILQKEIRQVRGNKSYLDKIVPQRLVREYSKKEKTAFDFIDKLQETSYDLSLLALVATFEKIAFAKYKTAFGTIKGIVGSKAEKPLDYYLMREKFVDGSIDKLHLIIELIKEHIDADLIKDLKTIKEQRDYIAHGKRFGTPPPIDMELEEIAFVLDKIILEIEK